MLTHIFIILALFGALSGKRTEIEETERYPDNAEVLEKVGSSGYMADSDTPVVVKVALLVESLSSFSVNDMSFDMDVYIRMTWIDERFSHHQSQPVLITRKEDLERFWVPDVYFPNAKSSTHQDLLRLNAFMRIYGNGETHFSARVTLTIACSQDLRDYPMDRQMCGPIIRSYSHSTRKMILQWFDETPIRGLDHAELPELYIVSSRAEICDVGYSFAQTDSFYIMGNFSCLYGGMVLQRRVGYHLVQTYLPTGMIVVISWVSFFIEPSAIPARVSLSFTTLLTLSTMAAGLRSSLPPVAYAKAIDIWIGVCTFFVFACLLQFAIVNSYMRSANSIAELRTSAKPYLRKQKKVVAEDIDQDVLQDHLEVMQLKKKILAKKIDKICRVLFPGTFLIFNLVYWPVYRGLK